MHSLLEWIQETLQALPTLRTGPMNLFADQLLLTETNNCITATHVCALSRLSRSFFVVNFLPF